MMHSSFATLGASLLLATSLGAQQTAGVISNPAASAVLPDIVAFDRVVSDRQELQFVHLSNQQLFSATRTPSTARPGTVVALPDIGAGTTLSAYAGQLDWRPVAEQGRSWYAYVASDEKGAVGLMLNYVDAAGHLAPTAPLRIPFDGQARTPRWSRDGQHLAFVSDSSVLYIVSDVGAALRSANVSNLRPTRVSAASRPALFPVWSPSGDHIAYGVEAVSGGNRNGAIEVLPVSPAHGEVVGTPVVVTGELVDDNEYRPSWSADGKYIAFYADQNVMGGTRQQVSIGVVEIVLRNGRVYRGIVKEGGQRWLADNVIPDEVRGPEWTSIADGTQKKAALLYVRRDATRNNPIVVADFQRWVEQLPRAQYETEMSSSWGAIRPTLVRAIEMNQKVRYVYTSVRGGGDVVAFHDVSALWARGPEPPPVIVASVNAETPALPGAAPAAGAPKNQGAAVGQGHKGIDVARALLFPGLGQFSAGQKGKGSFLTLAGVAGGTFGVIGALSMGAPLTDGKAVVDAVSRNPARQAELQSTYDRAKSDYDSQRSKALIGGAVFAAAWVYGILDASISSGPQQSFSLNIVPDRSGGGGSTANVGFKIPIGSNRR